MKGLTNRQREVLDFIQSFITTNEYPPSFKEIGGYLYLSSTKAVFDHLGVLEKKGYITRIAAQPRTIVLTERAKRLYDKNKGG